MKKTLKTSTASKQKDIRKMTDKELDALTYSMKPMSRADFVTQVMANRKKKGI